MGNINKQIISNLIKRSDEKNTGSVSNLKTCLIVQGGGMRSSYTMGCLKALEGLGLNNAFDCVLGSSAGAINGAYFIAGQSDVATKVYSDYINNCKFINFFRIWKVLDVNYLIKILSSGDSILNKEKVTGSSTDLQFTMVHYPSSKEKTFSIKQHPSELMNLIKASATIPALSNEKVMIGGDRYIDGAVVNPIPIKTAIDLGFTDILIILSRSKFFRRKPRRWVYNLLSHTYFRDWPIESKDSIFDRFSKVNELYDFIWSHEGDNKKYRVMIIYPEKDSLAGLMSKSKKAILRNIKTGYDDTLKAFSN